MEDMQYSQTKVIAWLLLQGRLNTKDMMKKKNFYVEFTDCVLCEECSEEDPMHLFFECSFSMSFWWALRMEWNTELSINDMIAEAKERYHINFLMEIIITGCWSIWDQRNDAIFNNNAPSLSRCLCKFKSYVKTNMHHAKPSLKEGMQSLLDTL
jgi:hypothetical protein